MVIASQALSSEIVIDKLIEIVMQVAIDIAAADRGLLVLLEGDVATSGTEPRAGTVPISTSPRAASRCLIRKDASSVTGG